jgi:hypothetical protein
LGTLKSVLFPIVLSDAVDGGDVEQSPQVLAVVDVWILTASDRQANVAKGALDEILPIDGPIGVLVELLRGDRHQLRLVSFPDRFCGLRLAGLKPVEPLGDRSWFLLHQSNPWVMEMPLCLRFTAGIV